MKNYSLLNIINKLDNILSTIPKNSDEYRALKDAILILTRMYKDD